MMPNYDTSSTPPHGRKRVVKRLAWYMMAVAIILTMGLYFTGVNHWYYILPAFPLYGTVLYINSKHHYLIARDILLIGSFLLFTFWGFTHRGAGAEYGLIAIICSIPMVYKHQRALVIALGISVVTLMTYLVLDRLLPFTPNPTINYPILSTTVLIMAGLNVFVQILLYRNTLIKYVTALKSKNQELDHTLEEKRQIQAEVENSNKQLLTLTNQLNWIVEQKTRELQTYIDAINISIYSSIIDLDGKLVKANEPLLNAAGYTLEELVGKSYKLFGSEKISDIQFEIFENSIRKGKIWRGEVRYQTKSGGYFWSDQVVIPMLDSDKKITYFLTIGLPVTERKLNEEMRNRTLILLQKLAFDTSHNVRGPIARILGLVSLVQNDMISVEETKYVMSQLAENTHELSLVTSQFVEFLNTHQELLNEGSE
jgi:PAS domain S-box-containing protein